MPVEVDIQGLADVLAKLDKLDANMQTKGFKAATRAGAKVILPIAQADAPKLSGFMASVIMIRSFSRPSKGIFRSSMGIDAKDYTGDAYYGSFLLFGHKAGSRKLGDNRKQVAANNFLKRSAVQAGNAAANAMIESIRDAIEEGSTNE